MNRTKIEWADYTWNPIVGCTHGCEFCYARRQAKRRKHDCALCYDFVPHLHGERLGQPQQVKSSRIVFADSMGDWWSPGLDPEARRLSFAAMAAAWWHHYVLLTKRPDLIDAEELWDHTAELGDADRGPGGLWLGVSVTCDDDWWRVERLVEIRERAPHQILVSFEPLLGPIKHEIPTEISWAIVGAQSGTGAAECRFSWVSAVAARAEFRRVPLFEKDNLRGLMMTLRQRWPEAMLMETGGVAAR